MPMDAIYWSLVMLQNPGSLVRDLTLPSQTFDTLYFDQGLRDQEAIARKRAVLEKLKDNLRKPRKKRAKA